MKLALIQPQFAPNLYDLSAMLKADRVIFLDTDTWSRKGRSHRAKIRNEEGTQWINIPVKTEDKGKAINQVRIDHSEAWKESFWNGVLHNYSTATYFDFLHDELLTDFQKVDEFEHLLDFNRYFFNKLCTYFEINISLELASSIEGYSTFPDVTAKNLKPEKLFLEHQSKNYQCQSSHAEVALKEHPVYQQSHPGFVTGCSALDLLLNSGKESFKVLEQLI